MFIAFGRVQGAEALGPFGAAAARRVRRPCASRQEYRVEFQTVRRSSPARRASPLISSAPSGEPCAEDLPALVGAPKPMVVRQAIITGLSDDCALVSAVGDLFVIVAIDAPRRPAGGFEALHLIDRVGERQRAVDRNTVIIEQHDQSVELEMAGKRDGFLRDAFHQVAVGGRAT